MATDSAPPAARGAHVTARASEPDRRGLLLLASGHFVIDASVGAIPALIPVFTALYLLSDLEAALILAASLAVSSALQPAFGWLADRRPAPAFLWGGVAVGAVGLAASGLVAGYPGVLACIVGSGLGVAAFHPEAGRVANQIAGPKVATGLAWFMVGGNAGFAAGPLLMALFIPLLDERATLVMLVPGIAVAAWLIVERARLRVLVPAHLDPALRAADRARSQIPGLILLLFVTSMRTWVQFGVLTLGALLLVETRGKSESAAAFAVFCFTLGGALGTLAGAWLADRVGGRRMLAWTMPFATPLIAGFLLLDGAQAVAMLGAAGFVVMASFSVTVVMGQEYLPGRLALAAGLMIGFGSIGSAAIGLALFGSIADAAGREAALWGLALLPLAAAAGAALLPDPRPRSSGLEG